MKNTENLKFYALDINSSSYAELSYLPWEKIPCIDYAGRNIIEMRAVGPGWPAAISWYRGGLICSESLCADIESFGLRIGERHDLKIVSAEEGCKKKKPPVYFYYKSR